MPENAPQPAAEKKPTCFIIMPLTVPPEWLDRYDRDESHFLHVLDELHAPAVVAAGFEPIRPIARGADVIQTEIIKHLDQADLVLCDMSTRNPNVFFELGIRTALNKPVCVVRDLLMGKVPFDVTPVNFHEYNQTLKSWVVREEVPKLTQHLKDAHERCAGKNPMWQTFGISTQADLAAGAPASTDEMLKLMLASMEDLRGRIGIACDPDTSASLPQNITSRQDREFLRREIEYINQYLTAKGVRAVSIMYDHSTRRFLVKLADHRRRGSLWKAQAQLDLGRDNIDFQ